MPVANVSFVAKGPLDDPNEGKPVDQRKLTRMGIKPMPPSVSESRRNVTVLAIQLLNAELQRRISEKLLLDNDVYSQRKIAVTAVNKNLQIFALF